MLWKDVLDAIAETCGSLRKHYSEVATIRSANQDGDHVHLTITRRPASGPLTSENIATTELSIEFQAQKPAVAVQRDGGKVQEFPIEADIDDAFVTLQGRELLLDEFSRLVLEDPFFSSRNPCTYQQQDPDKALEMARSLFAGSTQKATRKWKKIATVAVENGTSARLARLL